MRDGARWVPPSPVAYPPVLHGTNPDANRYPYCRLPGRTLKPFRFASSHGSAII
jgi:hypothetical protein